MISYTSNRLITTTVGLLNICNSPSFPFTSFPPFSSSFLSSLSFYSIASCLFLLLLSLSSKFVSSVFFLTGLLLLYLLFSLSLFSHFTSLLPPLSFFPPFPFPSFILFPFFSFSKFLFINLI